MHTRLATYQIYALSAKCDIWMSVCHSEVVFSGMQFPELPLEFFFFPVRKLWWKFFLRITQGFVTWRVIPACSAGLRTGCVVAYSTTFRVWLILHGGNDKGILQHTPLVFAWTDLGSWLAMFYNSCIPIRRWTFSNLCFYHKGVVSYPIWDTEGCCGICWWFDPTICLLCSQNLKDYLHTSLFLSKREGTVSSLFFLVLVLS